MDSWWFVSFHMSFEIIYRRQAKIKIGLSRRTMHGQMDREGVLNFCVSGVAAPQYFTFGFRMVFVFIVMDTKVLDVPFGTWSLTWVGVWNLATYVFC